MKHAKRIILIHIFIAAAAAEEPLKSDSRAPYVHRLTLYDETGEAIGPGDEPARPYSTSRTCGKCHPYQTIQGGWHFNAADKGVGHGRPGEPWILTNAETGTQIPISYRAWTNSLRPSDAGVTSWQFILTFGRHFPGSGPGEKRDPAEQDSHARWHISGNLEIDCLLCHSVDQNHDPAEWARQIEQQNFRWAPTAAAGLAVIRGAAKSLPDDWDPLAPPNPDYPEQAGPVVIYDKSRFDGNDRVFFNVTRTPPASRCYFCHTTRTVGPKETERWQTDTDVHLAAGFTCVDCHRNGIDHAIVRGYEDEPAAQGKPGAASLTCRGCHGGLNEPNNARPAGGRLGAPRPLHRGLPALHLDKLTCTACHLGPWPEMELQRFQTSMAHQLGLPSRDRNWEALPLLAGPVFLRQNDGKIAPHRVVWPAYWGHLEGERISPLAASEVIRATQGIVEREKGEGKAKESSPALSAEQVTDTLRNLRETENVQGEPVYVAGGLVFQMGADGKVQSLEHEAAAPYSWPLAHDVRPAAQSLGIRGCTDCHSSEGAIYFGNVRPISPISFIDVQAKPAFLLRGESETLARSWGLSFRVRQVFVWTGFGGVAMAVAVLLAGILKGIGRLAVSLEASVRVSSIALWLGPLALAATGLPQWFCGREMHGWLLWLHAAAAPVFIISLAAFAVLEHGTDRPGSMGLSLKILFWATITFGVVTSLSMLVCMLPVIGTEGQLFLAKVHSYAGFLFLVVAAFHSALRWKASKRNRSCGTDGSK